MSRQPIRRVVFYSRSFFLDNASGAAVASRAVARALVRQGVEVAALCGTIVDARPGADLADEPARRAWAVDDLTGVPPALAIDADGVPCLVLRRPTALRHPSDAREVEETLSLLESRIQPRPSDVLLTYGGDSLTDRVAERFRAAGAATVFHLHNFQYRSTDRLAAFDAIVVPSSFSADFHHKALGLPCAVLPSPIDPERTTAGRREPTYLTFVNPTAEKGVFPFARIADELGRRRTDIPILVVEARGDESTVASCGLELLDHGNVFFHPNTPDPRQFWGVTKVCLIPSLWWESQCLVAVEAMSNGIPVIASDRGALPETLGEAGIILPLPGRLTPATRIVPTAEEVAPWVDAILRLWDDGAAIERWRVAALDRSRRWSPDALGPPWAEFLRGLRRGAAPRAIDPSARRKSVVLVPHRDGIEWECEQGLRDLEQAGVRVIRRRGCSAIDAARSELLSEALHEGFESILFIDSDIGFAAPEALRLLARPEPVVAGLYAKKGERELTSRFADEIEEVVFGTEAGSLYPLKYAAAGFLRVRSHVLRDMVTTLDLPLCNIRWGKGFWPFFQPIVLGDDRGDYHYLSEDWSFSHRLRQIGVTPLADTTIRLWHYGRYGYGWEDSGTDTRRYRAYTYRIDRSREGD